MTLERHDKLHPFSALPEGMEQHRCFSVNEKESGQNSKKEGNGNSRVPPILIRYMSFPLSSSHTIEADL
jgi:hypothetical protein